VSANDVVRVSAIGGGWIVVFCYIYFNQQPITLNQHVHAL